MKIVRVTALVLSIVVLSYGSTARAEIITNGGFEAGNLGGWTSSGIGPDFTIDQLGDPGATTFEMPRDWSDPAPLWGPAGGEQFASLWSMNKIWIDDPEPVPDLDSEDLGHWITAHDSTMSQTFSAPAGYVLSFDYFFDYGDYAPNYDSAMATLSWPNPSDTDNPNVRVLFEHNTVTDQPDPRYNVLSDIENIEWRHVVEVLPATDTYTLTFMVTDVYNPTGEPAYESILGVDNVNVVPVPGALLLGALGLGSAGGLLRRLLRSSRS